MSQETTNFNWPNNTGSLPALRETVRVALTEIDNVVGGISVFRQGIGAPSDALGRDGDLYFQTDTGDVWQRQTGHYVIVANITGPEGPQGETGPQGPQGIPGTGVNFLVEYHTLTSGDIATKQITLNLTPTGGVLVASPNGPVQVKDVDFALSGAVVSWSGLGLEALLEAGDVLIVTYPS